MNSEIKTGTVVKVTIKRGINRHGAMLTLERLFMTDKAISGPLAARAKNFIPLPRRRGGRVWTKYPNKLHPKLDKGVSATLKTTPAMLRDLASIATFVDVAAV